MAEDGTDQTRKEHLVRQYDQPRSDHSGRTNGKSNGNGGKVAVLVDDGFEQVELTSPCDALREAGFDPCIISTKKGKVKGWQHTDWGDEFEVVDTVDQAEVDDFVGLVLPGGVINPDRLRRSKAAVDFVRHFAESGKPVAAICHGPWTLIEAGLVRGRKMTSYESISTDMKNAGARWVDQEVVTDGNFITSRKPDDLDAFNRALCAAVKEEAQTTAGSRR